MGIPDYQTLMLPLLQHMADGQEHSLPDLVEVLARRFNLSDLERRELLPNGGQFSFDNRVGWARTYLKKAGLLSSPKRGSIQITTRGQSVLEGHPKHIDNKLLRQFPEFLEFQGAKSSVARHESEAVVERLDPQESIEVGYQQMRKQLAVELLDRVKACSPEFFERLVVDGRQLKLPLNDN